MYFKKKLSYCCSIKLYIIFIPSVIIVNIILYVFLFSNCCVKYIAYKDIPNQLVPVQHNLKGSAFNQIQTCDLMRLVLKDELIEPNVTVDETLMKSLAVKLKIQPGGAWKPASCISQHHVAIVLPYRDRPHHLNVFLAYMHPFLQFQMLNYRIIVIEQNKHRNFNRGKLFNVGFKEAEKIENFACYVFTDIDLLPLNLNNIYACTQLPRHMSANIDIFDYKLPYYNVFGGASALLKTQFERANGFSNIFYGWGGEDDDLFNRITRNGSFICRFEANISKYVMLTHNKEKPNDDRYYFLQSGEKRFETDGLNSLMYTVEEREYHPLYTRILVDI